VPTRSIRAIARALAELLPPGRILISAAKGIEPITLHMPTEILADVLAHGSHALGVLSGPSFASDVVRGKPTAVVLAFREAGLAGALAGELGSKPFRLYHSTDVTGVEIGGAAKNVFAIAAGIVAGLDLGESARAAMIARGFAELRRLGSALGADPATFAGLSGLGDLVLTASSEKSRNFAFGLAIGRGEPPAAALAEGALSAASVWARARSLGVSMPIVEQVVDVIEGRRSPKHAAEALLARPFGEE